MKLIVGLGNPGPKYDQTRHNAGFMVVNKLAKEFGAVSQKEKGQGILTEISYKNEKIVLAKPLTYMNRSGITVAYLVNWFKMELKDLLIIYDDMDLPFGKLRMRKKGSAGGHNGMKSIIEHLGQQDFPRLRVGIGKPPKFMDTTSYVLGKFSPEEKVELETVIENSVRSIKILIDNNIDAAIAYTNNLPEREF